MAIGRNPNTNFGPNIGQPIGTPRAPIESLEPLSVPWSTGFRGPWKAPNTFGQGGMGRARGTDWSAMPSMGWKGEGVMAPVGVGKGGPNMVMGASRSTHYGSRTAIQSSPLGRSPHYGGRTGLGSAVKNMGERDTNIISSMFTHRQAQWSGVGLMGVGAISAVQNARDGRYGRAALGAGVAGAGYYMYKNPHLAANMANKLLSRTGGAQTKLVGLAKSAATAAKGVLA